MEQHNLCSDGDYVPQKQMIKAGRKKKKKRSMSVSLLQRENTGSLRVVKETSRVHPVSSNYLK